MSHIFKLQLTWSGLIRWYLLTLVLASLGTFLAYNGPLSSNAWRIWSGQDAWIRDMLRALVCALLGIFMIWSMNILSAGRSTKESLTRPQLRRYEWVLLVISALMLLSLSHYLIEGFTRGLPGRAAAKGAALPPLTFREIILPYFPYYLYVFGLWLGLEYPILILLIRRIAMDRKRLREAHAKLESVCPLSGIEFPELTVEAVQRLVAVFQDYVIALKNVGQRYVPVLLAVSLILIYEQLTSSNKTVTHLAVDVGKVALWFLLGPSLIICVTLVALRYQNAARIVDAGLNAFVEASLNSYGKSEPLEIALKARADLMWIQSPAAFVLSVMKSASVSILFLLTITTYVLKTLKAEGWLAIFLPTPILDFFKKTLGL